MADQELPDIRQIMRLVPHRYPFLLVDRVLACEPGKTLTAIKNVTINEPYFVGHFPEQPVMPGVLMLEAMAQASLLLGLASNPEPEQKMLYYFLGVDKARFKRQVIPGDQLILDVTLVASKHAVWKFSARARVGDELACAADLMAAPRPVEEPQ